MRVATAAAELGFPRTGNLGAQPRLPPARQPLRALATPSSRASRIPRRNPAGPQLELPIPSSQTATVSPPGAGWGGPGRRWRRRETNPSLSSLPSRGLLCTPITPITTTTTTTSSTTEELEPAGAPGEAAAAAAAGASTCP